MFDGQPGSAGVTLQGYYSECSQGVAYLNSSNSRVVGTVPIPCSYSGSSYSFSTDTCTYADSDGWHTWAQSYVQVRRWKGTTTQSMFWAPDIT